MNLLISVLLLMSLILGVALAARKTRNARYRVVKLPLLALLLFIVLQFFSFLLAIKPIEHFWYNSLVEGYANRDPTVAAIRTIDPGSYDQFKSKVTGKAKRERMDSRELSMFARIEAESDFYPRAREYLSNATDEAILAVARSHLDLLIRVVDQQPALCSATGIGISNDQGNRSWLFRQSEGLRESLVEAMISGKGQSTRTNSQESVIVTGFLNFLTDFPEYSKVFTQPDGGPSKDLAADRQILCDARIELLGYMLQQPQAAAASFFRIYYQ